MENVYQSLKKIRDEERPGVIAEPSFRQGVMWPTLALSKPPEDLLARGVMGWTRMAMATVLAGGEAFGWEKFINLLDAKQRPASQKKADRLVKEFNIEGKSAADCVNLMVCWAKGDLFNYHTHPIVSEHNLFGMGTWCPQVAAVEEMGLGDKAQNLRLWCDLYDSTICHSLNTDCRMVHAHCPSGGDRFCMFYIFEEEAPKTDSYYKTLQHFNDNKRKDLEVNPNPDYFEGMAPPRIIEGLSEAEKLKDGVLCKAQIGLQTLLICAIEYGWENFINLLDKEDSWGYLQEGLKIRRDFAVKGTGLRDAANVLTTALAMQGYDFHSIIEYTPERVEGVGHKCQVIEAAQDLGLHDKIEDVSLWCDFYHNHKIKAINPDYQLTHTHCLGRGDKFCRFVLK